MPRAQFFGRYTMKFFEGLRPQVYIHGAKLKRDKKTGKRLWALTMIVTLEADLIASCAPVIDRAWKFIRDPENAGVDLLLLAIVEGATIDFYAAVDDAAPAVHIEGVDLEGLRLTRGGNVIEFWFQGEKENSAGLHAFIKEYAFTRCWAAFTLGQRELGLQKVAEAKTGRK